MKLLIAFSKREDSDSVAVSFSTEVEGFGNLQSSFETCDTDVLAAVENVAVILAAKLELTRSE